MNKITGYLLLLFTLISCTKQAAGQNLQGDITRERIRNNEMNSERNIFDDVWPVQFSIKAASFDSTLQALNSISTCVLLEEFGNHDISPAKVHSWETQMTLLGDTIRVSRLEHETWALPIFFFNWRESFEDVKKDSKIERIETALVKGNIKYTLIDYLDD